MRVLSLSGMREGGVTPATATGVDRALLQHGAGTLFPPRVASGAHGSDGAVELLEGRLAAELFECFEYDLGPSLALEVVANGLVHVADVDGFGVEKEAKAVAFAIAPKACKDERLR